MFVLMGNLAATSGMARELYEAAGKWFAICLAAFTFDDRLVGRVRRRFGLGGQYDRLHPHRPPEMLRLGY
jgi:hypothetical protein